MAEADKGEIGLGKGSSSSLHLIGSLISHSVDTIFIIYCNKEQQHLHCCCCSFAPSLAEKEDIDCSKVRTWGSDLETHGK